MASWIFFGLAWLALVINHSIEILERINIYFKKRGGENPKEESGNTEDKIPETQVEEADEIKQPPAAQST